MASPCDRLPIGEQAVAFFILHQLRRMSQVWVRGVTLVTAQVWVLLEKEMDTEQGDVSQGSRMNLMIVAFT